MKESEIRFLNQWEKTRARGRWHYVLFTGLIWGVFTAIFSRLLALIFERDLTFEEQFLSLDFLLYTGMFTLIAGPLFGLFTWSLSERRYQRLKGRADLSQSEQVV